MRKINKIEPSAPVMPTRKKVAAYARVSEEKGRTLHSLSAQVSFYSKYIQTHREWEYAGVYADEGISGTTENRDAFKRLLEDCDAGKIDIVLTKSISRFARNTVDLLETVRHLRDIGVEVRFEKKDFDTANLLQKSKKEHNTPRYAAILGNIKGYFRCSYKCWCLVGV